MTAHLLALSVGPVQEFISAARRTRDLWFGSYLLSEISKAAARAVVGRGNLIFPSPDGDLAPDSTLNVANIVLAQVGGDPRAVAEAMKDAGRERWHQFADPVRGAFTSAIHPDIWREQIDDVLEFYAAWVPLGESYPAARRRLMRLLAGRKACRDFTPAKGRPGVPKSSLDGLRESVLVPRDHWGDSVRRRLRVSHGEQLDSIGLVKRAALDTRPYPSVARVAADPWLRGLDADVRAALRRECENQGSPIRQIDVDAHPHYGDFPFDGTAVFGSRHQDIAREAELDPVALDGLRRTLNQIRTESEPYLAVLVADGDRMGAHLSTLPMADAHRRFSAKLATFADAARGIVHAHHGVLVYAGGDDVLAFVPVDRSLHCARKLSDQFREITELTLSVGVAIGHFMEPLEDLLGYGRDVEKDAKVDRDALAVHLHKRGGGRVAARAKWDECLDDHLHVLAEHLNAGRLSHRLAYDLHRVAGTYDDWPTVTVTGAIRRDALRTVAAKQPSRGGVRDDIARLISDRVRDAASLRRLADEILIARQIARSLRQAHPEGTT